MPVSAKNVYIFLGPELGKKQDVIDVIKEKLSKSSVPEEFNYYAGETPVSEISDTLLNISLFSDSRIVYIKNAELIKKKDEIELLSSCVENMEEKTVLILLSDELKITAGLEDAVLKNSSKNNKQIFYEMFEKEKHEWLKQFFRRNGFNIDRDCANTILELVENNTDALKRECSKLMIFLQKDANREITSEEIEKWLSHNREESAFVLFSRIAVGDLSKSLESISVMLAAKQSAQSILAGLAWCFRKLYDYLTLLEEGNGNNSFELKKIGLSSPKAKDDYAAAANRYDFESVESCLALTAEYDMLLRSPVAVMENILMDRYILKIIKNG
ncbi:MAG: DNA polymerase III subunit delta [Treponema sp.]|nr:DNA polymerase III subunit delta [Treponema sp.]